MNRLLSSIGIGAATVDTLLPKTEFTPGETVEATVEMTGGNAEQEIDGLYFALLTRVDDEHVVVDQDEITESVSLAPGETRTLTTEVTVPPRTPVTEGECRVWLKTGLDISWAVDPNDEDVRGQFWSQDGTRNYQLDSTTDLTVTELGLPEDDALRLLVVGDTHVGYRHRPSHKKAEGSSEPRRSGTVPGGDEPRRHPGC